jgi:hypothetical protein
VSLRTSPHYTTFVPHGVFVCLLLYFRLSCSLVLSLVSGTRSRLIFGTTAAAAKTRSFRDSHQRNVVVHSFFFYSSCTRIILLFRPSISSTVVKVSVWIGREAMRETSRARKDTRNYVSNGIPPQVGGGVSGGGIADVSKLESEAMLVLSNAN